MKPVPFDYYVVYSSLWGHRKHLKLKRLLNITDLQAYAIIISVFRAAAIRETDGDFSQYSAEDLSAVCCWDTPADITLQALIDCNILTEDKVLYSWEERQPIFRARERIKKARERNCTEQNGTVPNCTVQNGTEIHRTAKSKSKSKSESESNSERKSESKEREKENIGGVFSKTSIETSDKQSLDKDSANIVQSLSSEDIFDWQEYYSILRTELTKRKEAIISPGSIYAGKIIEYGKQIGMAKMKAIIPKYFEFLDSKQIAHDWGNANGFVMQIPHLVKGLDAKPVEPAFNVAAAFDKIEYYKQQLKAGVVL